MPSSQVTAKKRKLHIPRSAMRKKTYKIGEEFFVKASHFGPKWGKEHFPRAQWKEKILRGKIMGLNVGGGYKVMILYDKSREHIWGKDFVDKPTEDPPESTTATNKPKNTTTPETAVGPLGIGSAEPVTSILAETLLSMPIPR